MHWIAVCAVCINFVTVQSVWVFTDCMMICIIVGWENSILRIAPMYTNMRVFSTLFCYVIFLSDQGLLVWWGIVYSDNVEMAGICNSSVLVLIIQCPIARMQWSLNACWLCTCLAVLAIVADQLLHKGVGQKHHIDENQTQPCDLVQPETEQSQDGQDHKEEEQQDEAKLDVWDDRVLSIVICNLYGSIQQDEFIRKGLESEWAT